MPRTAFLASLLLIAAGCCSRGVGRQPHWEVAIQATVNAKPDPLTTTSFSVTLKRPVAIATKEAAR